MPGDSLDRDRRILAAEARWLEAEDAAIHAALAVACQARGLSLIEFGPGEAPGGLAGVVYYRPYTSRGATLLAHTGVGGGGGRI